MLLNFKTYKDKVMGCWAGKNIGGVLGAPFEGTRQLVQGVDFYTQDLSGGPPPNDDLDLQIAWLAAVERYGRNVNASILGEYWLSYVIPNWVEYGTGKANLRAGLEPPLAGLIDNTYKDSCGCFIRSEIWACLAPGHPQLAARYAYEDAIVDHQGEGMYGEVFCAALQSAAFVESDPFKLIDIALSYIPENGALARCVKKAVECYRNKVEFTEARKRIHNEAPGTFGIQGIKLSQIKKESNEGLGIGAPGFDAPENVGFTVAGLLYGEGDFGKAVCLAN
jgi:ADP-ribosylglycohydrolase